MGAQHSPHSSNAIAVGIEFREARPRRAPRGPRPWAPAGPVKCAAAVRAIRRGVFMVPMVCPSVCWSSAPAMSAEVLPQTGRRERSLAARWGTKISAGPVARHARRRVRPATFNPVPMGASCGFGKPPAESLRRAEGFLPDDDRPTGRRRPLGGRHRGPAVVAVCAGAARTGWPGAALEGYLEGHRAAAVWARTAPPPRRRWVRLSHNHRRGPLIGAGDPILFVSPPAGPRNPSCLADAADAGLRLRCAVPAASA